MAGLHLSQSTSEKATTLLAPLLKELKRSDCPFPPAPMAAMFSLSLGAVYPFPMTCLGTIKKPAAASELFLRKFLLLFCLGIAMYLSVESMF
jgi:hypothetical protein